jgi:histidinol-phosphate aminotransferase
VPSHVIVVLDEAYYEYASAPAIDASDYPDGMQWLNNHSNLVVTRTFSKAYGLAGLRIGYSVSHSEIADVLNRVRQPFNVNSLALAAAEAALQDHEHLKKGLACNIAGMQQYTSTFTDMGLEYIPSIGNFICVKVGDAAGIYESLLREGVIVRPVANYGMPEFLRISIGTNQENESCIKALQKVISK